MCLNSNCNSGFTQTLDSVNEESRTTTIKSNFSQPKLKLKIMLTLHVSIHGKCLINAMLNHHIK